jgi:hypothetical protein
MPYSFPRLYHRHTEEVRTTHVATKASSNGQIGAMRTDIRLTFESQRETEEGFRFRRVERSLINIDAFETSFDSGISPAMLTDNASRRILLPSSLSPEPNSYHHTMHTRSEKYSMARWFRETKA